MSHKVRADQIRTINKEKYRFSCNGKEWKTIDQMLEVSWEKIEIQDWFVALFLRS